MASRIREIARALRQEMTPTEATMWEVLRNRRLGGFKFLRQHPLVHTVLLGKQRYYIADFYCAAARLVVEFDGGVHLGQQAEDDARDILLAEQDIQTLRFRNEEVEDLPNVKARILEVVLERVKYLSSPHPPSADASL